MSTETTNTVLRYYLEAGVPKVEAVRWVWVQPAGDRPEPRDPGLAAKGRALPAEYDPGLYPNLWVWVGVNDPAVKLPRPDVVTGGQRVKPDGTTLDTLEHHHHDDSRYWDFYRLPLRPGVELVTEAVWRTAMDARAAADAEAKKARDAAQAQAVAAREAAKATARVKLAALGLDEAEIAAITGG